MSEIHPALTITPDAKCGPAMKRLNDRQRAFVCAVIEMGGINHTRAALAAGYGNGKIENAAVQGNRLIHDEDVLNAVQEEAQRRLRSGAIMSVQTLLEIASDVGAENKDRLKAVEMILNRSGLHATTEHHVKVEHRDTTDEAMVAKIKLLAKNQGLDPVKLLGSAGVIDAEFKEVAVPQVMCAAQVMVATEVAERLKEQAILKMPLPELEGHEELDGDDDFLNGEDLTDIL